MQPLHSEPIPQKLHPLCALRHALLSYADRESRQICRKTRTRNQQLTNVFRGPGRIIAGPKTLRSAAGRRDECVQVAARNQQLTNVFVSDFPPNSNQLKRFRTLVAKIGEGQQSSRKIVTA